MKHNPQYCDSFTTIEYDRLPSDGFAVLLCSRLKIVFRLYKNLIYSLIVKYLHREEKWKIELENGVDDDDEKKRKMKCT